MTTHTDPAEDEGTRTRISASVETWRRKLLDLSKRNRAIHFRPAKVSTVAITDELPAEIFRQLYLRERSMRFKAAPVPDETAPVAAPDPAPVAVEQPPLVEEEDDTPETDFAPYDAASLDERHTDEWLQTASTPEALDKSLRRLDEQAALSIEEQGVNTLFLTLGMLHYTDSDTSELGFRAPLVLLPVTLARKSARAGYSMRAGDDDPMVNPALAELLRREHGITLPDLPPSNAIGDDYDLQTLFARVNDAIAQRTRWSLKSSVYLGLFSFQKLVMYKDLEANEAALARHRIVRNVILRTGDEKSGAVTGLPPDVRDLDLDAKFAPESTHQVVDADSSQLRAIAGTARNYDLVIEGPPGTGKSQTITNLIAQALGEGKSVLFVAEKMAALSVVYDRLVKAGLGEFCLELHSTKANKRAVMKDLGAALDASLQRIAVPTASTQRLPEVRGALREYVEAVHSPLGSLGVSPWTGYGELGALLDAKRVVYTGPVEGTVTFAALEEARRRLRELAAAAPAVGDPAKHPWRDSTKTFFSAADIDAVRDAVPVVLRHVRDVERLAVDARARFGLPEIRTFAEADTSIAIAEVIARSPGAPLEVLQSAAWNAAPLEATRLVERGRALADLESAVLAQLAPEVLGQDHADDTAFVERKTQGVFAFLAGLNGRFRAIRRRWAGWRRTPGGMTLAEQADWMKKADRVRAERSGLDAATPAARPLFGELWQGATSDWTALDDYVRWVVEFRETCVRHGLGEAAQRAAAQRRPDISVVRDLETSAAAAREALTRVRDGAGWPSGYLETEPFGAVAERLSSVVDHADAAPRWAAFEAARSAAAATPAAETVDAAMTGAIAFDDAERAFLRAFWLRWLSAAVQARPSLERFHTATHEQRVAEFRELDQRVLIENRARLVASLRERVQTGLREPDAAAVMPHLRGQMTRQRGLAPLRTTMRLSAPAIRVIKPCLLMSPMTVAQLLDGQTPGFDLAIFDEASQLTPEDAVGAIVRARQLVVVGDSKQLPPTNFFAVASGTVDAPLADDGSPLYEDSESILEQAQAAGFPHQRLKWHYRSAHESLITFSNVQFYDSDLRTFPSVDRETRERGLRFEHVGDGLYEGNGLNAAEARRVADEVMRFARGEVQRGAAGQQQQSLGVGTFNVRQQLAIQDELEQRRRADPSAEPFFDRGAREPFFVKNLENIQGDERDVIFLSVTYARSSDGRLRYNLGPLNGENGWRRLNVLTTRARQRMCVFSSIRYDEIAVAATSARGAKLLRDFLQFAEHGRLESLDASVAAPAESPLERDVLAELKERGCVVVPQVGASGYRVDLGIVDVLAPGRFLCGIECDGASYRASETARDRDRLRQQVLEARGWTIHRVWSTDWFKDRQGQIERLMAGIDADRRRAREEDESRRLAREVADRERAEAQARETQTAIRAAHELAAGSDVEYQRPVAQPYATAPGAGRYTGEILAAPASRVVQAVVSIVEAEGPIHETELTTRVASFWGARAGSRIQARIDEAVLAAEQGRLVHRRGPFLWNAAQTCTLRSRAGTRIAADRIAPEEYREAVLAVLGRGHGFSRAQLTTEVRSLFGYGRTGAALEEAISAAIAQMLAEGRLGEGSTGIRLRT